MPTKQPTLKAMIIRTFAAMGPGEPLTSQELADGLHAIGFDFGAAANNDIQRVMLVEKVLKRLEIDRTLTVGAAGDRKYWHVPTIATAVDDEEPGSQPAPLPTQLPTRPSNRAAARPFDDSGDHLLGEPTPQANRFAAAFAALVVVIGGAIAAICFAVTPSQFAPRGSNYDPAQPYAPVTTATAPPTTRTVPDADQLPPDFVADTLQPPATGTEGCATVYGHSFDGTQWVAPYCGPESDQP
jgi:hypothetical protein